MRLLAASPALAPALLAAAGTLVAVPALPAELQSPLTALSRPENRVALVRSLGPGPGGQRFAVIAPLHGEASGELALRTEGLGELCVDPGRRVIVGFTDLLWRPLERAFVLDPEGPRLLAVDGVGPALLADHAALHRLLARGESLPDAQTVDLLLDLLAVRDPPSRHLAATELQMQPTLWTSFGRKEVRRLRRALEDAVEDTYLRFELLQVAAGLAGLGATDADWVATACRDALADVPVSPDFATHEPALAIFALQAIAERGGAEDAGLVARHLESTHPTVGAAAARSLFAVDPEQARVLAAEALARGTLHAEARQTLEALLRRVEG